MSFIGQIPEGNQKTLNLNPEEFTALMEKIKRREIQDIDDEVWQSLINNIPNHVALVSQQTTMMQIVQSMKEIPILPSEIPLPGDNHPLTHVEFLPTGGILTYMGGYDEPYRGFPYHEFVDKIDLIKKLSRQTQSGFYHAFVKKSWWAKVLLIPLIPSIREVFWAYTYTFFRLIERFMLLPVRFSQPVREIYRVMSIERPGETKQLKELRTMMRDVECMILEFDNAYRFRVQHLLPQLDKTALRKNPVKEINRLLDIWIEHEIKEQVADSWRLLKMFTSYYLRFDRKLLNLVVDVLLEINPEEIKMTKEDWYYFEKRLDYKIPLKIGEFQ